MKLIQSLQDLADARQEAIDRIHAEERRQQIQVRIGMGSCGIAAGAADTYAAFQHMLSADSHAEIEGGNLLGDVTSDLASAISIVQTGCVGLCALEPIVQVSAPGQPAVTYGKVTPDVARRILQEHIGAGLIVSEYVVENI